ncbi:cytochrome P450 [Mycobacterium intermedium]|uniref:Cytochrome P450 n=1 Tax=Mycobacterium intermedium TaxID=28445 RepID=A0A1E3SMF1_MYCIE|nr:cytochrome P450 [Mycobacterium intermedium]MCV6963430.1 cytochrome P450 [Mycobacterium intermedium]ODR02823.1 cytochrome [Mycobacterium intermedium]OPE47662.1 cytochrome P450 [Mycobacterium intermedium]ORA98678.1 cytochrome P450 [Mycobacterium intermedium]
MSKITATMPKTALDSRQMLDDPFARLAYLREHAPVSWATASLLLHGKGGYLLTRYDDVVTIHSDERFSTDVVKYTSVGKFIWLLPPTIRMLTQTMVFKDDPDHKRLRTLVHKAFTPRFVRAMTPEIAKIADRLAEDVKANRDVDLVHDFAVKLPLAVIATMLGVADEDRDRFQMLVEKVSSESNTLRGFATARKLVKLFEGLVEERRLHPDEGLISELVRANEGGDQLSHKETIAMVFLLLLAGHDTTANLIGSSVLALIEHPDQQALLREQPELLETTGLEELLRFTSPVADGATRLATEDVEIRGVPIPRGSQVVGSIVSANRDEAVFDNPDSLDLTRKPNKHLAFAFGIHYCLGHQLARLEGRAALATLLERFPNWELTAPRESLHYKPTVSLRGLNELPIRMY